MELNDEMKEALAMAVRGMVGASDPETAGQCVNDAMDAFVEMGLCRPEWATEIRAAAMAGLEES